MSFKFMSVRFLVKLKNFNFLNFLPVYATAKVLGAYCQMNWKYFQTYKVLLCEHILLFCLAVH